MNQTTDQTALRLGFDRGTIVCAGEGRGLDPGTLPGMKWDERVGCFRAPARFWPPIVALLKRCEIPFEDGVSAGAEGLRILGPPDLRPYQAAALDAWRLASRRGVVVLPTGSGKTRVAVAAIAGERCRTLCLVPTRVLLEQWRAVLETELGVEVGCYGDGERTEQPITVATFESAWRHMHTLGNRFELLIADEVHHFGGGGRDEALEMCTASRRLGLTATPPEGVATEGLRALIGPQVFELGIEDLAGSWLAEFELIEMRLGLSDSERHEYERNRKAFRGAYDYFVDLAPGASWEDFARWAARTPEGRAALAGWRRARQVLSMTDEKSEAIGRLLDRHQDGRVLIFTADQRAAYRVTREQLVMPITADIKRKERDRMLAAFREGSIGALVSARVLNEGLDVPAANVGIICGGAQGRREHVQRIGRLLRPAPGKRAVVYELVTRDTVEVGQARRKRHGITTSGTGLL